MNNNAGYLSTWQPYLTQLKKRKNYRGLQILGLYLLLENERSFPG